MSRAARPKSSAASAGAHGSARHTAPPSHSAAAQRRPRPRAGAAGVTRPHLPPLTRDPPAGARRGAGGLAGRTFTTANGTAFSQTDGKYDEVGLWGQIAF